MNCLRIPRFPLARFTSTLVRCRLFFMKTLQFTVSQCQLEHSCGKLQARASTGNFAHACAHVSSRTVRTSAEIRSVLPRLLSVAFIENRSNMPSVRAMVCLPERNSTNFFS